MARISKPCIVQRRNDSQTFILTLTIAFGFYFMEQAELFPLPRRSGGIPQTLLESLRRARRSGAYRIPEKREVSPENGTSLRRSAGR
jgi:hypothetical protein